MSVSLISTVFIPHDTTKERFDHFYREVKEGNYPTTLDPLFEILLKEATVGIPYMNSGFTGGDTYELGQISVGFDAYKLESSRYGGVLHTKNINHRFEIRKRLHAVRDVLKLQIHGEPGLFPTDGTPMLFGTYQLRSDIKVTGVLCWLSNPSYSEGSGLIPGWWWVGAREFMWWRPGALLFLPTYRIQM